MYISLIYSVHVSFKISIDHATFVQVSCTAAIELLIKNFKNFLQKTFLYSQIRRLNTVLLNELVHGVVKNV